MRNIFRSLNQIYYLIYTLVILLTMIGYFMNLNGLLAIGLTKELEISMLVLQSVLTIASVLSYLLLAVKMPTFSKIADVKLRALTYYKYARLRLLLIGLSLFDGIISLYVGSQLAIYLIAISAVLLLVSKPAENKIDELLS